MNNDKFIKMCPAYKEFNVFGLPDKGCCYNQMKYCSDVPTCVFKTLIYTIKKCDFKTLIDIFEDEDK